MFMGVAGFGFYVAEVSECIFMIYSISAGELD